MTSELQVPSPKINIGASIHELRRKTRQVLSNLDALTDKVAEIERDLEVMARARNVCSEEPTYHIPGGDPIAYNLDIRTLANGSVDVVIDGGVKFSLGPRLAGVFQFLASGEKERGANDELVGWRSRAEINKFLNDATGKQLRACYVNNLVHLLRMALSNAHYDSNLIQSNRQKGYRFALKHSSSARMKDSANSWL
jgi:hypothetical protein